MDKKLIIGLIAGGACAIALYLLKKKKKYATIGGNSEEADDNDRESTDEKIVKGAEKMVNWILEHKDQIEAVTTGVSFITSLICLKNAIRPKHKKGVITLDEKELKAIINDRIEREVGEIDFIKKEAVESFLDNAVYRGGRTMTRSDGASVCISVLSKGEAA